MTARILQREIYPPVIAAFLDRRSRPYNPTSRAFGDSLHSDFITAAEYGWILRISAGANDG
jgi:hypothetical protein